MTRTKKKALIPLAKKFITACNVVPLVHAKEGGVIYLEEILVDFLAFKEQEETKEETQT